MKRRPSDPGIRRRGGRLPDLRDGACASPVAVARPRRGTGRSGDRGSSGCTGPICEPAPAVLPIRAHARPDRLRPDEGAAPQDPAGADAAYERGDRPDRRGPPRGLEDPRPARRPTTRPRSGKRCWPSCSRHVTPEQLAAFHDDLRLAGGGPQGSRRSISWSPRSIGSCSSAGGSATRSPARCPPTGTIRWCDALEVALGGHRVIPDVPDRLVTPLSEPEPAGDLAPPAQVQESPLGRRHRPWRRPGDGAWSSARTPRPWSEPVGPTAYRGRPTVKRKSPHESTIGPVRPETRTRVHRGIRMKRIARHLAWLLVTAALLVSAAAVAGRVAWAQQAAGRFPAAPAAAPAAADDDPDDDPKPVPQRRVGWNPRWQLDDSQRQGYVQTFLGRVCGEVRTEEEAAPRQLEAALAKRVDHLDRACRIERSPEEEAPGGRAGRHQAVPRSRRRGEAGDPRRQGSRGNHRGRS